MGVYDVIPSLVFVCLLAAEPDNCFFGSSVVDQYDPLPPADDRIYFHPYDSNLLLKQMQLCSKWQDHCRMMQGIRGWDNDYWQDCIKRLEWQQQCWQMIFIVQDSWSLPGDYPCRIALQKLKEFLGEELYRKKYSPPLLPEVPVYVPVMPRASDGGAN